MRTVWKYPVSFAKGDDQVIEVPGGAEFLTATGSPDLVEVWALVSSDAAPQKRHLRLAGTGHALDTFTERSQHVATWSAGPFVWHLFDLGAVV